MNFVFALGLFIAVLSQCGAQNPPTNQIEAYSQALRMICKSQGMSDAAFNEIIKQAVEIGNIIENSKLGSSIEKGNKVEANDFKDFDEFCNTTKPTVSSQINKLEKKIQPCLDEKKRFIVPFLARSIDGVLDFACEEHAQNLKDLADPTTSQCFETIKGPASMNDVKECARDLQISFQKEEFNKEMLCTLLNTAQTCVSNNVPKYCPGPKSKENQKLVNKVFDAFLAPCSSNWSSVSNIFIILAAFFISKL